MTYPPEVREDLRLLRLHHRRLHRITELAHAESRHRAEVAARLRDRGVPFPVIAAAIDVTAAAIHGMLARAGITPTMGAGNTITASEERA